MMNRISAPGCTNFLKNGRKFLNRPMWDPLTGSQEFPEIWVNRALGIAIGLAALFGVGVKDWCTRGEVANFQWISTSWACWSWSPVSRRWVRFCGFLFQSVDRKCHFSLISTTMAPCIDGLSADECFDKKFLY